MFKCAEVEVGEIIRGLQRKVVQRKLHRGDVVSPGLENE